MSRLRRRLVHFDHLNVQKRRARRGKWRGTADDIPASLLGRMKLAWALTKLDEKEGV